jgi:dTDP-4-amino-4,6-dideoxygalactose transaminase
VRTSPLAPWPQFEERDIQAAADVLRSGKVNYWTGSHGRQFEIEYAQHLGVKHAVALANGTLALELALVVLGIGPGDEVITTSRTFIASASAIVMRGARPVLADIDRDSGNVSAETIAPLITPRTKAIIAVHLAGWPCDMNPILALARRHDIKVIEDCAQAHGAVYKSKPVGSLGDISAFSFCQDKIITTGGEGGLLATNNEQWWERAWSYKDHGKSFNAVYRQQHAPGFRWLHEDFGTNWRLTEMQAVLGRNQLARLDQSIARRRANAGILIDEFSSIDALRVPVPVPDVKHSYYKFYCYVRPERLAPGWNRDRVMEAVSKEGIPCFSGSCSEIYLEKAFPAEYRPATRYSIAKELGETSLMFLVHPTLSEEDMRQTAAAVRKVMDVATSNSRS